MCTCGFTYNCNNLLRWDIVSEKHIASTFRSSPELNLEDGGDTFLRNVGNHLEDYKVSKPSRLQWTPSDVTTLFAKSLRTEARDVEVDQVEGRSV